MSLGILDNIHWTENCKNDRKNDGTITNPNTNNQSHHFIKGLEHIRVRKCQHCDCKLSRHCSVENWNPH